MPDAPFTADDIVIEFVPRKQMAERAAALCEQYVPDRHINESQAKQLVNTIAGNALIGREKSVVIAFIDYKASRRWIREMMFHEFTHIYCAKMEMDGEHFIDIYGSGTTPENPDMTSAERTYDGFLVSGHYVWSEFMAQYYALLHTAQRGYRIVKGKCFQCVWASMSNVTIEFDFGKKQKYRFEAFCYGPKSCKYYKMGKPRAVPYKGWGTRYDDGWMDALCTENRGYDD